MSRIAKVLCTVGLAGATWLAQSVAYADQPQTQDKQATDKTDKTDRTEKMARMTEKTSATATVVKVDTQKRHLVLRGDKGMEFTMEVPESVKRLDELKPGDKIKVNYYESMALSLKKPAPGEQPKMGEQTLTERQMGKLPSGSIAHRVTGTVEVTKIDRDAKKITIKKPDGQEDTLDVSDPQLRADLDSLKEGDRITATYVEAAAITVMREEQSKMKDTQGRPSPTPTRDQGTQGTQGTKDTTGSQPDTSTQPRQ